MMVLVLKCKISFYDTFSKAADFDHFGHTRIIVGGLNFQGGLRTWTLCSMNFISRNVILFMNFCYLVLSCAIGIQTVREIQNPVYEPKITTNALILSNIISNISHINEVDRNTVGLKSISSFLPKSQQLSLLLYLGLNLNSHLGINL